MDNTKMMNTPNPGLTPWELGRAAYHNSEDVDSNPFEYGTEEHNEFETSFTDERERGNTKISMSPRTVESLVTNLNRAINNSSSLGSANSFYELVA